MQTRNEPRLSPLPRAGRGHGRRRRPPRHPLPQHDAPQGRGADHHPQQGLAADIQIEFRSYNSRRYGRPWAANITFPDGIRPHYEFDGYFDGNVVLINAQPGSVIAYGQKDHRRPDRSQKQLAIVQADGTLRDVSESEARKHVASGQKQVINLVRSTEEHEHDHPQHPEEPAAPH